MATHSPTTLGVKEDGREGARKGGGEGGTAQEEGWREGGTEGGSYKGCREGEREGGSKEMVGREGTRKGEREGDIKGREVGSDDARQTESVSGGMEGGTSEEGTGRGMDMDSGREEASRGGIERGREGARE